MTNPDQPDESRGNYAGVSGGHNASAYMLSGILVGALAGVALERLTGQRWVFIPCLLGGVGLSLYTVWLRYVRPPHE